MAIRREALTDVFREIYEREPAITSADVLLEFANYATPLPGTIV